MKKKILILSLMVNFMAGAFVLYAFTSKTKNVNDGGSGYVVMRVVEGFGSGITSEISISDGNTIISHEDLASGFKAEKIRSNNQIISKNINDLKSKGYELISSNSSGGSWIISSYVFVKK